MEYTKKEIELRKKLKSFIQAKAEYEWIGEFVNDVVEYDWSDDLDDFTTEELEGFARELGLDKARKGLKEVGI